ncbi:LexA family protein [Halalkalibacter akibai]|uniref:SOS-response repressor and protease LexA n=1 Tax=Halalkalibacter akibai (strain ATCC 43226 / DSM 21942 / CIP 109018 / JCM 9157 / 1139) TaxID=1236973 RepID=W4QX16_HALA3|nr:LexA family transcriptional regulator [Halalkalibacter akibai]GAE36641.1 SOS-response repressor and protease LexA [Halalkalibacter akibai JCM 9157]
MQTFGQLLKEERLKRNLTQAQLGELLGVTQGSIASYERDEKIPRSNRLKEISSLFNLSPNALLGHHSSAPEIKKIHGVIRVPVIRKITVDLPIDAEANIIEYTYIPDDGKYREGEVFILEVSGDSMEGRSRICKGDRVLVQQQDDVESGEIAVVAINGEDVSLRRVTKTETGEVILYPDNSKYAPMLVRDGNAKIYGKVVQVIFEPL